jgi:hypothetical protein
MNTASASRFEQSKKQSNPICWWSAIKRSAVILVLGLSLNVPQDVLAGANPAGSTGPGPGQTAPLP